MRVLVCGGRNWGHAAFDAPWLETKRAKRQRELSFSLLDTLDKTIGIDVIVHGDARGADTVAKKWAESRRCFVEAFPADWKRYGRAAGPIRNTTMLMMGTPDLVVVFPGGIGTSDMMGKAIDADGVEVIDAGRIEDDDDESGLFGSRRGCSAR